MNQPSSFAAIVTFAFNKRQLVWAAEDVTLVGLREDGLIHRETPSAGEKQDKETRQINESKFAAVFAARKGLTVIAFGVVVKIVPVGNLHVLIILKTSK